MKYFNPAFYKFFDQLALNNNRDWFEKNKPMYEQEVKLPMKKLVEDLSEKLAKYQPEINRDASKALFRIYRDVRFSKDKSPYKLHVGAVFSRRGTKDLDDPGFYFQAGAHENMIGGGKYEVTKEQLAKIRQEIMYNHDQFKKILQAKGFKTHFKTLLGDKNKVLAPEIKEFALTEPLVANKQFWYASKLSRKDILSSELDKLLLEKMKAAFDMNHFLREAIRN